MNPIGDLHRQSQNYFKALPKEEQARCTEFFKRFDTDGSNMVTREELASGVPDKDRRQIMGYFDVLDIDCDGVLDFEECVTLYYLLKVPGKICYSCHQILPYKSFCTACGIENHYVDLLEGGCKANPNKDVQAKNPIGDLHRQSMNYYTCLPPAEKAKCMEFFKWLDEDESRKVTRRELALAVSDKDRRKILSYFDIIDLDCDGMIDFDECVTLYYLLKVPGKICSGCSKVLPYKSYCDACRIENLPTAKAKFNY